MVEDQRTLPHCVHNCLLHNTAFLTDSIERSTDLVWLVFHVRVKAAPLDADGKFILP